ncbi:unnamed protein product [Rhizophagus irregularis]|nr:unnamed protein product [Rhizophagus irregularis]
MYVSRIFFKTPASFVPSDETYSFSKHYEYIVSLTNYHWLDQLSPIDSDCFLNCEEIQVHRGEEMSLASIERKNMTREDTKYGKKKIWTQDRYLFRIDNMEYFGSETYTDEDLHNSKPINYKHKLFREMKDQLDHLLKNLKVTKESIKGVKNIVLHGITHGGTVRQRRIYFQMSYTLI